MSFTGLLKVPVTSFFFSRWRVVGSRLTLIDWQPLMIGITPLSTFHINSKKLPMYQFGKIKSQNRPMMYFYLYILTYIYIITYNRYRPLAVNSTYWWFLLWACLYCTYDLPQNLNFITKIHFFQIHLSN